MCTCVGDTFLVRLSICVGGTCVDSQADPERVSGPERLLLSCTGAYLRTWMIWGKQVNLMRFDHITVIPVIYHLFL